MSVKNSNDTIRNRTRHLPAVVVALTRKVFTTTATATTTTTTTTTTTIYKQPDGKWSASLLTCFSTQYEKHHVCVCISTYLPQEQQLMEKNVKGF